MPFFLELILIVVLCAGTLFGFVMLVGIVLDSFPLFRMRLAAALYRVVKKNAYLKLHAAVWRYLKLPNNHWEVDPNN